MATGNMTDRGKNAGFWPPGRKLLATLFLVVLAATLPLVNAFRPAWSTYPDPDLIYAYNAMVLVDWLPQEYFDHTGYIYLLLLAAYYKLLGVLGILDAYSVSTLPPVRDRAAYDSAWTGIVQSSRALMMVSTVGCVLIFAALVGNWKRDWRLGLLAGVLMSAATGVISMAYFLRTEMMSWAGVTFALLLLLLAPRQRTIERQLLLLAAVGFCGVVAVLSKVSAIIPLFTFPLLAFILIDRPTGEPRPEQAPVPARTMTIVLAAGAALLVPAAAMAIHALLQSGNTHYRFTPLAFGIFGLYQAAFAVLVLGAMALYARWRQVPLRTAFAATIALGAGIGAGLLLLLIKYDPRNVIATLSPIEALFVFSTWSNPELAQEANVLSGSLFGKAVSGAFAVLKYRFFPTRTPSNMHLLEWAMMLAIVFGRRDQDRRWILQAVTLVLIAWAIQVTFELRRSIIWYYSYTDPLVIMAAIIVAERWKEALFGKYRWGTALFLALYLYAGQGQIRGFTKFHHGLQSACDWQHVYLKRLERFPECAAPPPPR